MKVVERRLLRGPNIHADGPVFVAVIDLEALAATSSAQIDGFADALLQAIPTVARHRCSPGHVGGFVERLRDGTYLAHVVEHVTLELQCLAGNAVGFGRTRALRDRPGSYRVVVGYAVEAVVRCAFDSAVRLVARLAAGLATDSEAFDADVERLRRLATAALIGPSTRAIVDAACERGVPVRRLGSRGSLFQLGWGARQQRIQATMTSRTGHIAVGIASDKALTKLLVAEAGLPVPRGRTVTSADEAVAAARAIGAAVVVKPLAGNQGKGVTTAVVGDDAVIAAYGRARAFGPRVLVERHVPGDDHRVLVVGNRVVAAARRRPPEVVGDGRSTIRALVDVANTDPRRGEGHMHPLTRIRLDEAAIKELAHQSLDADAVPEAGRVVRLRGNANLSTGGTAADVTAAVHPDTAAACVRAVRRVGLDVAGIDLVCSDIAQPLAEQGAALIEVNAAPGIRMHEYPSVGTPQPVGRAIVDALFPDGDDGRIPIVAVTGTNGKTTTTLALAHVLHRAGRVTGVTTTEGVSIDGRRIRGGDCTGYRSARAVLAAPEVEIAVLETARGGIVRRGLGFDRSDVGVVLNVTADHLGQDGIVTMDDLARVKGLVVATARRAVVLNADDPICVKLASRARPGAQIVWFGFEAAAEPLRGHLEDGGAAVYEKDGTIVWAHGGEHITLVAAAELPFTLGGRARHNVANAMAACAALLALDIAPERIVEGLRTFEADEATNPMRLNVHQVDGKTVVFDYAHNVAAYRALIDTVRPMATGRVIGVVSVPGDRRPDDLAAIGRLCAEGFDRLVIYEMDDRRRREAGETADHIARGVRDVSGDDGARLEVVLDVRDAIRCALGQARPGDVVALGCASHVSELEDALGGR